MELEKKIKTEKINRLLSNIDSLYDVKFDEAFSKYKEIKKTFQEFEKEFSKIKYLFGCKCINDPFEGSVIFKKWKN